MNTLRLRLQGAARAGGVNQIVVERDYIQTYLLAGITSRPTLRDTLVFKGGTALKKVHFKAYRFSEDLDFTGVNAPTGDTLEAEFREAIETSRSLVHVHGAVGLELERIALKLPHPGGQDAFVVRVQYPWQPHPMVNIKLELTHDEPVLLAAQPLPVAHGYDEPLEPSVSSYCLEEIAAEKLRATRQTIQKLDAKGWARSRGRDFYDLLHLARRDHVRWDEVSRVLPEKCARRDVEIRSIDDIFDPRLLQEVRAQWKGTLGAFVPSLPDVDSVLRETRERLEAVLTFEQP
jgi:uncharacterized protein